MEGGLTVENTYCELFILWAAGRQMSWAWVHPVASPISFPGPEDSFRTPACMVGPNLVLRTRLAEGVELWLGAAAAGVAGTKSESAFADSQAHPCSPTKHVLLGNVG